MRRNRLHPGDDALSPVVGAVLLVGIAVILMGVVGAFVFGFGFAQQPPESDVQFTQTDTGSHYNVTITVVDSGGLLEEEVHVEVDGERACVGSSRPWSGSGSLSRGEEVEIDGYGTDCTAASDIDTNQTVTVIWREEGGDQSQIVGEFVTI